MPASNTPIHVQYRNATYYGGFDNYQRNGSGLLILDNSNIILAHWSRNSIHGKYLYISDTLTAFGNMAANRLDGYNIVSLTSPKNIEPKPKGKEEPMRTVYGMFREDRLYGKCVFVESEFVSVGQFSNNELK